MKPAGRWSSAADVLRSLKYRSGLDSERMLILDRVWEKEVGHFSRHWSLSGIRRGVLYVKAASPAAAQELQFRGREIVRSLNKYFSRAWIKGIRTSRD